MLALTTTDLLQLIFQSYLQGDIYEKNLATPKDNKNYFHSVDARKRKCNKSK